MGEETVRAAFASQADWCGRLGSEFTSRLCAAIGPRIDRSTAIGRRVLDWPGDPAPEADNLPARLCGGLHWIARQGEERLAPLYPPAPLPTEEALWAAVAGVLGRHGKALETFLENPPQTNEVGRSAVLIAGLLALAARFHLPLRLFELGASAGLNLLLDRYGYDLGGVRAGDPASPLQLAPEWTGPPPPDREVRIRARCGVDLRPGDPRRDRDRLLAYVWPDQHERLVRMEAALAIAARDPAPVARGDAAEWLERTLPAAPREGAVRVVMHSIAFQYFPADARRRIEAVVERVAQDAAEVSPVAWLRYEQQPGEDEPSLRLRTWPGEDRLLAWAHGHGSRVRWLLRLDQLVGDLPASV